MLHQCNRSDKDTHRYSPSVHLGFRSGNERTWDTAQAVCPALSHIVLHHGQDHRYRRNSSDVTAVHNGLHVCFVGDRLFSKPRSTSHAAQQCDNAEHQSEYDNARENGFQNFLSALISRSSASHAQISFGMIRFVESEYRCTITSSSGVSRSTNQSDALNRYSESNFLCCLVGF
jgi:hypothetical protein